MWSERRIVGFIDYNGSLTIDNSLLTAALGD